MDQPTLYRLRFLLPGLLVLVMLSACQTQAAVSAAGAQIPPSTATSQPTPTLQPTMPAPVVEVQVQVAEGTKPAAMPSFNLVDPNALTKTAVPTLPPASTSIPLPATPTETPQPTFTPPALPLTSSDEHYWFRRPVAEGGVVWTDKIYPYGSTRGGQLRPHHGVEFNVPYNTEILAAASGTVRVAGSDAATAFGPQTNFYGNLVVIEHDTPYLGQSVYTLYGHLNQVLVSEGQKVNSQDVIGLSGATGVADGPHMHFEVRVGQNSYDATRNPLLWLYPFPDRGVIVGRVVWPDGGLVSEAPVRAVRVDADSPYAATTSYADNSTNADEVWQENFAFDDVYAGYYEVTVYAGEEKYTEEVWVYPYRTSSVEIVIDR